MNVHTLMKGICGLLAVYGTQAFAQSITMIAETNANMAEGSTWSNGIAITADGAAGLDYVVEGKTIRTPNNVDVTTKSKSLTITDGVLGLLREHASGYSNRSYVFPGLVLNNSGIQLQATTGGNWYRFESPVTFTGDCSVMRQNGGYDHTLTFTSTSGISGSGTLTLGSNSNNFVGFVNQAPGNYTGDVILGVIGSNHATLTLDQPLGAINLSIPQTNGGKWTVKFAAGSTAGMTGLSMERANTVIEFTGNHTLQSVNLTTGTIQGGGTLTLTLEEPTAIASTIGGNLSLVKQGDAILTLSGNVATTGGIALENGTLAFEGTGNTGSGPLTFSGGNLQLNLATTPELVCSALTCTAPGTLEISFDGVETISSRHSLGKFTLSGDLALLTPTTTTPGITLRLAYELGELFLLADGAGVSQQDLTWSVANGIWSTDTNDKSWLNREGTPSAYSEGDFVTFADIPGVTGTITVSLDQTVTPGDILIDADTDILISGSGQIEGDGRLIKGGNGILTIDTAINLTSAITIKTGTLRLTSLSTLSADVYLEPAATLILAGDTDIALNGAVTGSGTIIKQGTGALSVSGGLDSNTVWMIEEGSLTLVIDSGTHIQNGLISGNGTLKKEGGGTLQLEGDAYKIAKPVEVNAGTLALTPPVYVSDGEGFTRVFFDITKVRRTGDSAGGFAVTEIELLKNGIVIPWPTGTTATLQTGGAVNNNPSGAGNCFDNKVQPNNKWYDSGASSNNDGTVTRRNAITITMPQPVDFDSYRICQADRQSRDPVSWIFKAGSAERWNYVSVVNDAHLDANGNQSTGAPMPTYPNGTDTSGYDSHSIPFFGTGLSFESFLQGVILGENGTLATSYLADSILPPVAGNGKIAFDSTSKTCTLPDLSRFTGSVTGYGTLKTGSASPQTVAATFAANIQLEGIGQSQTTVLLLDNTTIIATLTGNIGLLKNGSGIAALNSPDNTFTGPLQVQGGSLQIGATAARYFRFRVDETRWNETSTETLKSNMQLSELQPMYRGKRIVPDGWTYSTTGGSEANLPNLFDDNTETKWGGTKNSTITVDFGRVTLLDGYSWHTGNDCPYRDPLSWTVLLSDDGENWRFFDAHTADEKLVKPDVWESESNTWDPLHRKVQIGPFTASGKVRYFKMAITETRVPANDGHSYCSNTQLADLQPMFQGQRIVPNGWTVEGTPSASNLQNLIDGVISGTSKAAIGKGSPSSTYFIIDFQRPTAVDSYQWYTANDCPNRDPVSWRIEVSNDKQNWVVVDEHFKEEKLVKPDEWLHHDDDLGTDANRHELIGPFELKPIQTQILPRDGSITVAENAELFCGTSQNMGSLSGDGRLVLAELAPDCTVKTLDIREISFTPWPEVVKGEEFPVFSYESVLRKPELIDAPTGWKLILHEPTNTLRLVFFNGTNIILY